MPKDLVVQGNIFDCEDSQAGIPCIQNDGYDPAGAAIDWIYNLRYCAGTCNTDWSGSNEPTGTDLADGDPDFTTYNGWTRLQASGAAYEAGDVPNANAALDSEQETRDGSTSDIGADEYIAGAPLVPPIEKNLVGATWIAGFAGGPIRSEPLPANIQSCDGDPTTVEVSFTTAANADCKLHTTADVAYASMDTPGAMDGGQAGTAHTHDVTQACGESTVYYARCEDTATSDVNTTDLAITVEVDDPLTPPHPSPVFMTGTGNVTISGTGNVTIE